MFNAMARTRLIMGNYKYYLAAMLSYVQFVDEMEALQCILGPGWVAIFC
jgi:hypothetical protein